MAEFSETVSRILRAQLPSLPADETERAKQLQVACRVWNALYDGGTVHPNLADPVVRFTYVYLYAGARAAILRDIFACAGFRGVTGMFGPLFQGRDMRICSLGAGPGTDALPVEWLKHYNEPIRDRTIHYALGDLFTQWRPMAEAVVNEVAAPNALSDYFHVDLSKLPSIESIRPQLRSDAVLMNYSLGAAQPTKPVLNGLMEAIADELAPGGTILITDQIKCINQIESTCDAVLYPRGFADLMPGRAEFVCDLPQGGLFQASDLAWLTSLGLPWPSVKHSYRTLSWKKPL